MSGSTYRRTRADGSPGRWHAVIDLPPGTNGKRRQKTTTHDTKHEAQAWLSKMHQEARTGDLPDDKITVATFLTTWLDGKKGLRPSTLVDYHRHIEQLFVPELGHLKLIDLRPRHIDEVLTRYQLAAETRGRPVTVKTSRRILATLHSALEAAVRQGLLRRNPASMVELPRPTRYHPKVWTKDQAELFLRVTEDDPLGLVFRLLLITGMRRGEVIALQWGDLDLTERSIHIRRAITLVDGELIVGPPKSEAGDRTVFLDATTTDKIQRLQRRAVLEHPWDSGIELDDTFVFSIRSGPLHPAHLSRRFTTLCKQAGVPVIRLHSVRHTSASLALAAGEPLLQVSRRLGHSSIAITADTYSQVTPEAAKSAATTLSDAIIGT
ncbi:tyrosine-type recombinase/integrase [uncultured Phycicoccus sp.]|uniref:tyrosine-type recombinase/integrase n=1 Tax=uncultured Phycicoccus sp. TaxID=661422 RepID=UPI0026067EB4|nr:tyrosine-type recombinase/integrase [uncultured Phycicoccus sp.]